MSNANFTPLGNRKWPPRDANEPSASSNPFTSSRPNESGSFVDTSGEVMIKAPVTGACRKCGFTGHLPYQCRNFIQIKPSHTTHIDVSSTSSEEYETPLNADKKDNKEKKKEDKKLRKLKKQIKKKVKKERKRHRSSSFESDDRHKRKKHSKKSSKKKKHRRRSSSSSSSFG